MVAHTCNSIHVYEFSWTIENFTTIPQRITGPSFFPIPYRSEPFRFRISNSNILVSIPIFPHFSTMYQSHIETNVYLDVKYNTFLCDVSLTNANDEILKTSKLQSNSRNRNFNKPVMIFDFYKKTGGLEFLNLPGDKLILKARFSLSSYDVGHKELSKDLKTMFGSGLGHDMTFYLGGKTIPSHTAILCNRSPVFAKMFQHDMLENTSKNVVIKNIAFTIFNAFLIFLYTGEMEDKGCEAAISLYFVADKYEVASLRKECSRILANNITVASVCRVLSLADLHGDTDLKETAKTFLRKNFTRVVETSGTNCRC